MSALKTCVYIYTHTYTLLYVCCIYTYAHPDVHKKKPVHFEHIVEKKVLKVNKVEPIWCKAVSRSGLVLFNSNRQMEFASHSKIILALKNISKLCFVCYQVCQTVEVF